MILLTGGSGLLGTELRKLIDCDAPSHAEFDILEPPSELSDRHHMIVHCAAYTDVAKAQSDVFGVTRTNVLGTLNLCAYGMPLVYISTEYVFDGAQGNYNEHAQVNPINAYGVSKAQAESYVKLLPMYLIIRTLFKPRPFKHPQAITDQYTTGDYVDVIAPKIARAIRMFEANIIGGIINIGTDRKSTYELARLSRDVQPCKRADVDTELPRDTSLNCSKWNDMERMHGHRFR